MKLYTVLFTAEYDCGVIFVGTFSTKELAEAAAKKHDARRSCYNQLVIFEHELDEAKPELG